MPLQATSGAASYDAFGGGVPVVPTYIEEVFSTQVYTGTGATNNIVNGIDLAGKGGLVWTKARTTTSAFTFAHALMDTLRGAGIQICSDRTDANTTQANSLTSFNSDGYTLGADTGQGRVNNSSYGTQTYVGWTFRKQPKFFDVVTYTGNGTAGRTVAHNLGSVPGCIIVKRTDAANGWPVYHRSMNASPQDYMMRLNATDAAFTTSPSRWNNTLPTSTEFTLSGNDEVNGSGGTYVAYVFAHNAGGFGLTGTDNVISCGSYTGNGSATGPEVNIGYEPQWLLIKEATQSGNAWSLFDNMRGLSVAGPSGHLRPNASDAEDTTSVDVRPTATGFQPISSSGRVNRSGETFIYIAIRRGPMKVPTDAAKVFSPVAYSGTGATRTITAGFPVDLAIPKSRGATGNSAEWYTRLIGPGVALLSAYTFQELARPTELTSFASNTGVVLGDSSTSGGTNASGFTYVDWNFQRAPGFFDEVCYTGTGVAKTETHNLGVVPELIIVKDRTVSSSWRVYSQATGNGNCLFLQGTQASTSDSTVWNNTSPTSSVFTIGTGSAVNEPADKFVAYLFATCAGVSKCTAFTGTGTLQTINCGFTSGARFVLIKRTDSTGDWYVWDSSRGLSSSTDPYLLLNSTAAEVTSTNWVDTTSTGFQVTAASGNNVNINGASYIALAIA